MSETETHAPGVRALADGLAELGYHTHGPADEGKGRVHAGHVLDVLRDTGLELWPEIDARPGASWSLEKAEGDHAGPSWPAVVIYLGFFAAVVLITWMVTS